MTNDKPSEEEVYRFIRDQIDSVPHLEALLLLWNSRPQPWTIENLGSRLYVSRDVVNALLKDLVGRMLVGLVPGNPEGYRYAPASIEQDQMVAAVDATYRREVVRVSTLIHSKPSAPIRAFAQAFRFTKERG